MDDFARLTFPYEGKTVKFAAPYVTQIMASIRQFMQERYAFIGLGNLYGAINYVVDVGACVGGLSIAYSLAWENATILAIEPSKYNYPFLQFNTKPFPNVKTVKIAAHNKKEQLRIAGIGGSQRCRDDNKCNTGLISPCGASDNWVEVVEADTLDNIVEAKVDWLKLDIEGHEVPALQGAKRILGEDRPMLQVEIRPDNQEIAGYTMKDLFGIISDMKYTFVKQVLADFVYVPSERV